MNNIGRIIELLTIPTSTRTITRFRDSRKRIRIAPADKAPGAACGWTGGTPVLHRRQSPPRQAPPRIRHSAAASRAVTIPGRGNLEKWRTCPVLSAS